ncbi:MAG: hypothetical protein K9N47_05485 [Prosthecobacter sp.]|uniref:hypothetical protein n=1 Tax=Prosthecobacter sp. TaxID=1965333 RepID=UPI0025D99BC9|nr:hypothetical protein [Prosthecobacter sp.]MCF7785552.1 hypothetical protein [Prosthecobacter sp.]
MTRISDMDLARLWLRVWRPEPGIYAAPAATVKWDGTALICAPGQAELDPAAALLCPALASRLAQLQRRKAAAVQEPSIAALEACYGPATAALAAGGAVMSEGGFRTRLAECRGCDLWRETAREGRGLCDSVKSRCSHPLLWLVGKRCPESKWAA